MVTRGCAAGALGCAFALAGAAAGAGSGAAPAAAAASASDRYEAEWAERIRPWRRRPVVSVIVEQTGLGERERDAASEPEPCTTFRPSAGQVRAYVARAKRVSQRGFLHESDWSACHATGRLRFQGGQDAQWMVQRLGAGYLRIDGARYYFDCSECALGAAAAKGGS